MGTTNPPGNIKAARPDTATGGWEARWAPPPWPFPAPRTRPTFAPVTNSSFRDSGRRKLWSPWNTPILTSLWHMITDDVDNHDLGGTTSPVQDL